MKSTMDVKQMSLTDFEKYYGISPRLAQQWVHSKGFPAYKLGGMWYVDIPEFLKWREKEHLVSYKYA